MSKRYYVKARGRVAGPFPEERLRSMAQQGQLSRIHNISTDGQQWVKAGSVPELFQVAVAAAPVSAQTAESQIAAPSQTVVAGTAVWHYGINGQSTGPVAEQVIADLITKGKLSATDKIWNASFEDWKFVKDVNQWAALLPHAPAGSSRKNRSGLEDDSPNGSTDDDGQYTDWPVHRREISKALAATVPWLYFISIVIYLVCIGLIYGCVHGFVTGFQLNSLAVAGWSTLLLAGILTMTAAGVFLQRSASFSNRFVIAGDTDSLRRAMVWFKQFWITVGVLILVCIAISIISYGYSVAIFNRLAL